MGVRWLKLTLAYDGGAYAGWQIQPDKPTVQGALEAALRQITQETIRVSAAGRTDAGVHARAQVVSFLWPAVLADELSGDHKFERLRRALDGITGGEIAVKDAEVVPEGFDGKPEHAFLMYQRADVTANAMADGVGSRKVAGGLLVYSNDGIKGRLDI